MTCKNCGAPNNAKFCEYCGAANNNIAPESNLNGNWPVAVIKYDAWVELTDEERDGDTMRFCAYDITTQSETAPFLTVEECLGDLQKRIKESLEGNESAPSENDVKNNKYVVKLAKHGDLKIKYINISTEW